MKVDIYNTDKKYNIIYADPPWSYKDKKNNDPKMGGITYPTMELEDIKRLPIKEMCNKDCSFKYWIWDNVKGCYKHTYTYFHFHDYKRYWFLTKEEAEERLKNYEEL